MPPSDNRPSCAIFENGGGSASAQCCLNSPGCKQSGRGCEMRKRKPNISQPQWVRVRYRAQTGQEGGMKFGSFYELEIPLPWEPGKEQRVFREGLEQVALADRLGFNYVWATEHHFLEEYAHSSAPEVFLAACSQRTKRIRLGHGVTLLPLPYNHPARVAERIATLDLVSEGRVEFGTGESSSEVELGGFCIKRGDKRGMWQESLGAICRMFTEEPFMGHEGKYFTMPPRNVVPKPVQKPHPPLWVADRKSVV